MLESLSSSLSRVMKIGVSSKNDDARWTFPSWPTGRSGPDC